MSKKFGFISNLEEDAASPKIKYQLFEAEIGFEKMNVLIPFDNADAFAQEAELKAPKGRTAMQKLASRFGGTVE